jgi:hypothetical protein
MTLSKTQTSAAQKKKLAAHEKEQSSSVEQVKVEKVALLNFKIYHQSESFLITARENQNDISGKPERRTEKAHDSGVCPQAIKRMIR